MTIRDLLIFGATGDLTSRLLVPGLASLAAAGDLPDGFRLIGSASSSWSTEKFRSHVRRALGEDRPEATEVLDGLAGRAEYQPVDVTDHEAVRRLVHEVSDDGPVAIYLALPTGLHTEILQALRDASLPAGSRIVVEKPFGDDVQSANALNEELREAAGDAGEDAVYRVDHVLAMSSLQNLLTLRLRNRMVQAIWSDRDIECIEVLWEETLDLQGRASFYDKAGALRDVMQNHMMQLLCRVAMEPPADSAPKSLDEAVVEVLRHTSVALDDGAHPVAYRARYTAGTLADTGGADGSEVDDYVKQIGVDPDRDTETLAEVELVIDTPRWRGTRFVMRAGKALSARRKGVLVHFRPAEAAPGGSRPDGRQDGLQDGRQSTVPDQPVSDQHASPMGNHLWIGVDGPNDVRLSLLGSTLGPPPAVEPLRFQAPVPPSAHPPYATVLADILSGGSAHSVSAQEPAEAWRILEPVLAAWGEPDAPMGGYPAGSEVPPGGFTGWSRTPRAG